MVSGLSRCFVPYAAKKPAVVSAKAITHTAVKIVLAYAVFAALWILLSDAVVRLVLTDPVHSAFVNAIKGWIFVAVTAALLFVLMRRFAADIDTQGALSSESEHRINDSKAEFESFFNLLPELACVVSADGCFKKLNLAWEEKLGFSMAEVQSRSFIDFVHPEDVEATHKEIEKQIAGTIADSFVNRYRCKDGSYRWLEWKVAPVKNKTLLYVTARDITERKQVQKALIAAETKSRNLLESIQLAAVMLDCSGAITFCNNYFLGLTGWSRDEVFGRNFFDLFIPEAERNAAASEYAAYFSDKALHDYEGAIVTRNGVKRLVTWNNSFLWDSDGNMIGIATIGTDITEKRHLEEQLQQSQKMEAVGTLAGGIAHDFNNILTVIMGYAYLIREDGKDITAKQMAEEIITSASRAEEMTKSLLAFSRKQTLELIPTDINDIIREIAKSLPRLIREDIAFKAELSGEHLSVMADKWQLEQVIINLAVNARDAMPTGGVLSISTGEVEIVGEEVGLSTIIQPGRYGLITVADNGDGMDRKTQDRIFEPFFTTKEVGKGTGLGLSMVYGAITKHGGYINVYSEPCRGTTFKIYLPLLESQSRNIPDVGEDVPPIGSETVLLVEDDEAIRHMTKQLLENYGYHVLVAVDGEEAVSVFRDNRDSVQFILTDVIMPRKNGREAFEEIAAIKPGIPAIFMSGYSADVMAHAGAFENTVNYLAKPLKPALLLRTMRDLLAVHGGNDKDCSG